MKTLIKSLIRKSYNHIDGWWLDRRMLLVHKGSPSRQHLVRLAMALILRRRFAAADEIIERGLKTFPDDPDLNVQFAQLAQKQGHFDQALPRWQRVQNQQPELVAALCGIAASAREMWQMDKALATISEALARFPDHLDVLSEAAKIADKRNLPEEAILFWQRVLKMAPHNPEASHGLAHNLIMSGRHEEAGRVLDHAIAMHPDYRNLVAAKGILAMAQEDWGAARQIWAGYRQKYPDDMVGWEQHGHSIMAQQLSETEMAKEVSPLPSPVEIKVVEDETIRTLLLGFESIGSDCEFGMVQRRYGAEPLGLLRWNNVRVELLIEALKARFERMGDPEMMRLSLSHSNEYYIQDRRWDFGMHTFMFKSQVDGDTLLPKLCRRVTYLRDRFLEDVQAAEKTFVFKSPDLDLGILKLLFAGLRQLGPVKLLHVRPANAEAKEPMFCGNPGEVQQIEEGLFIGFIPRLGNLNGYWDIAFEDWVLVCQNLTSHLSGQAKI